METQTDADGITTRFNYDARRRLYQQTEPGGRITEHRYDGANNRVRTTRPNQAEWNFEYNADKQLTAVISAEGHRTEYGYDKSGNRVRQKDAEGILTTTAFDARNRATSIDQPIGGDEGFEYNGANELVVHTDRSGQRIEIERDGLGRVTARTYGSAQSGEVSREAFTLNGDGQATALSQYGEAGGPYHVSRAFDRQGRLHQEIDRFLQLSTWTYDEVGNRLQLSDPAGTTNSTPDRLNRTAQISTAAGTSALDYTPAGRLRVLSHGNGARSSKHRRWALDPCDGGLATGAVDANEREWDRPAP